jgi:hypothetical protein
VSEEGVCISSTGAIYRTGYPMARTQPNACWHAARMQVEDTYYTSQTQRMAMACPWILGYGLSSIMLSVAGRLAYTV